MLRRIFPMFAGRGKSAVLVAGLLLLEATAAWGLFFRTGLLEMAALAGLLAPAVLLAPEAVVYVGLLVVMGLTQIVKPELSPGAAGEALPSFFNVPALVVPGLSVAWLVSVIPRKSGALVPSALTWPLVAFCTVTILSLLVNSWHVVGLRPYFVGGLLMVLVNALAFVLAASVIARAGSAKHRERVVLAILLAGIAGLIWTCLISGRELLESGGRFGYEYRISPFMPEYLGGTVEPETLGLFAATMAILALALTKEWGSWPTRALLACALAAGLFVLLAAWSRTTFVGFTVAIAVMLVYGSRKRVIVLLAVLSVGLGLIVVPHVREFLSDTFLGTAPLERFILWRTAAQMATEHPLLGVGPGQFSHFATWGVSAHNIYLNTAGEMGFPALVILIWLILGLWKVGMRACRYAADRFSRAFLLAVVGIIALHTVSGFFGESIMPPFGNRQFEGLRHSVYLWLFAGIAAGWAQAEAREQAMARQEEYRIAKP